VLTFYVYDGSNQFLRLDSSSRVTGRSFYGVVPNEVVAEDRDGATRWLLADQVGTVRDVVGADGSIKEHYIYDSFGNRTAGSVAPIFSPQFGGESFSTTSGFGHYLFRWYDPAIGRFIEKDLVPDFGYVYAGNNPLSYQDRFGLELAEKDLEEEQNRRNICISNVLGALTLSKALIVALKIASGDPTEVAQEILDLKQELVEIKEAIEEAIEGKNCEVPSLPRTFHPTQRLRNPGPNPLRNPMNQFGLPRRWRP
jgi:RHS repeat-associated protein